MTPNTINLILVQVLSPDMGYTHFCMYCMTQSYTAYYSLLFSRMKAGVAFFAPPPAKHKIHQDRMHLRFEDFRLL